MSKPAPSSPQPRLLAGGNPQIAKADGDAPVQAYIAAIPGWKEGVARRLDEAQLASWVFQAAAIPSWGKS